MRRGEAAGQEVDRGAPVSAQGRLRRVLLGSATTWAGIFLTVEPYKIKGYHKAHVWWSGATSANVNTLRNGTLVTATVDDGIFTDATGQKGSATHVYEVCEANTPAPVVCSNAVEVVF